MGVTFGPQLPVTGLLTALPRFCEDDLYAIGQKINGRRLMLIIFDGQVQGLNKKGEVASVPAAVAQQALRLRGRWVFDGELIDGSLVVFDMPVAGEQITPDSRYVDRRRTLEAAYARWAPAPAVQLLPVAWTHHDKASLAKRLLDNRAEGCIANHLQAPYTPGRENPQLTRFKYRKSVDCFVIDVGRDGKANMAVALFDADGKQVEVAEVTACAGDGAQIVAQYQRFLKGEAPRPVIDVTYLMASEGRRLVQPTLPRLRDDLAPEDCLISQLQYESKELLDV